MGKSSKRIVPPTQQAYYDNYHFAPAVIDGKHLRCSGVIGVNPKDGSVSSDATTQFTQAFDNLAEVLTAGGASFADITEMTTFHVGLQAHLAAFMAVKDRYEVRQAYCPSPCGSACGC